MLNTYLEVQKHGHARSEFIPYEHLRVRTKRFPWGDGNKVSSGQHLAAISLFWKLPENFTLEALLELFIEEKNQKKNLKSSNHCFNEKIQDKLKKLQVIF